MPTILLKKSDTPGSVPGTANLTNLAGGAEVAVNTADKRMFSMTSASAVIELGTNPSSLTCADASFTVARVGSLTISSLSLTNATVTSATVTTLTGTSANITTVTGTTAGFSSANITQLQSTSATITTLTSTSANITTVSGTTATYTSATITNLNATSFTLSNLSISSANITTLTGTNHSCASATITTGNLTFSSTAQRITGDFSNATHANRLSFQSTTTNGATTPFFLPNGTAQTSGIVLSNASDPTNCSYGQFRVNGTSSVDIVSSILGTGTYLPMTFATGNAERMRLDTSGNLGIGTASPTSKLHVYQTGSASTMALIYNNTNAAELKVQTNANDAAFISFYTNGNRNWSVGPGQTTANLFEIRDLTASATRMGIDSSGNVGIGTSTASFRVTNNFDAPAAWGNNANNFIEMWQNSGTNALGVAMGDDSLVSLTTNNGYSLLFATSGTERMRIDTSGNVGIGTASPGSFDPDARNLVVGGGSGNTGISIYSGTTGAGRLMFADGTSGDGPYVGQIHYDHTSNYMRFITNGGERMRIDSSGNVGIGGTANAYAKVEALGTYPTSGGYTRVFRASGTIPSGTTAGTFSHNTFQSVVSTQAAAFTCPQLMHFEADNVTLGAGSAVTNQYGFYAEALTSATNNFGFYGNIASGTNRWNFYAAGTASNYFAGNVGINVSPVSAFKLHVAAATNVTVGIADGTGVAGALTFNAVNNANSANVPLDFRSSATYFSAGIGTTGSAANAYIDNTANNQLLRSTSSLRYKRDVATYARGLSELMTLRAVSFKGISESDGDKTFAGLIAEEVHDAGLTEFVAYDNEGRPDALHYGNMVALLVKAIQELEAKVAALEAK